MRCDMVGIWRMLRVITPLLVLPARMMRLRIPVWVRSSWLIIFLRGGRIHILASIFGRMKTL